MTAPVGVVADVCHSGNAHKSLGLDKLEKLLPHWGKIYEMDALSEIFLCDLQFCHERCLLHHVENRGVWLAWLEVERPVLALENHVSAELPVNGLELSHSLLHAVFALVFVSIHETSPHDNASEWLHCVGQHVCSVGMSAVVVAWSRLSLTVCLYEKSSEVGNNGVYFLCLCFPPFCHLWVERVGSL